MFHKYGKAIAQVLMAVLVVAAAITTGDGRVSGEEWFQIVLAAGSAVNVYLVPAVPEWPWMKTAVAAVMAGITTAGSVALDGVSTNDLIVIAIAIFGVALTAISPANSEQRHRSTNHPTLALLVAAGLAAAMVGVDSSPAHADTEDEMQYDCEVNWPNWGSAGYYATFSGVEIGVNVTVGWQYVGGSSSACEDINIRPNYTNGYFWNSGIEKVRTYMCNSSGSCWYNAWRNCQGGCEAATAMVDGTKYQVHMASYSGTGWNAKIMD